MHININDITHTENRLKIKKTINKLIIGKQENQKAIAEHYRKWINRKH